MGKSITSKKEKLTSTDEYLLKEMLRTHAMFELVAVKAYYNACLELRAKKLPEEHLLKAVQIGVEEVDHFLWLEKLYETRWPSFREQLREKLAAISLPAITCKEDLFAASWIFDRSGLVQMQGLRRSRWREYSRLVHRILKDEAGHTGFGFREIRKISAKHPSERPKLRRYAEKWLRASLLAFGTPNSFWDQLAIQRGLKTIAASDLRANLVRDVNDGLVRVGIAPLAIKP